MPPPVMCAMPLTSPRSSSGRTSLQIRTVRREQRVADRRAELRARTCPARKPRASNSTRRASE